MLKRLLKTTVKSKIAKLMLCIILIETLMPLRVFALTSGPSQPEMQSFEPVGTTDLVDQFTGDFNYNIPLMDVEGYPINIAYHSGINMDQEASWVGLGWNINPGNITHNVRGIPDDFKGDSIEKTFSINPEISKKFSASAGAEFFGAKVPINIAFGMNFSNYSGISANFNAGFSVRKSFGAISSGINVGLGASTDQGADFDYNVSLSTQSKIPKTISNTISGSFGQQFNSRQGLLATTYGITSTGSKPDIHKNAKVNKNKWQQISSGTSLNNSYIPISQSNFVPVITNAAFTSSKFYQIKIGGEIWGGYGHVGVDVGMDKTEFNANGTRNAFGYLYMQDASIDDIVDFTRDRDGRFNRKMKYLPSGSMTYDIYNVSGQGTSGNFRPFRSDVGLVYDPYVSSDNQSYSIRQELGLGTIVEAGADFTDATTHSFSGPWNEFKKPFSSKLIDQLYEPFYFKQAGELTLSKMSQSNYNTAIKGKELLVGKTDFYGIAGYTGLAPINNHRVPRSNLMYFSNAAEASSSNVSLMPRIASYPTPGYPSNPTYFNREGKYRKGHHISEVTQLLPDGRRYIYGIPAMNIEQTEYVASVNATSLYSSPLNGYIDGINPKEGVSTDPNMGQEFHMKSVTPAHAHSYLLTSVLSTDYTDLTGDGITDDDLGEYTKFNYTLKDNNYKWRTPFNKGRGRLDMGVRSDCHDDKATVITGRKEIWMLHSIESRNYVAEFYISPRTDGAGSDDPIIDGGGNNFSYKLDKIVLYNKQDRKLNGASAFPIKTVFFTYDYSLCKGIPNKNTTANGVGKLTLKAISIQNGNSDIGLLSPYRFDYGKTGYLAGANEINPDYDEMKKDVWGEYKEGNSLLSMTNFEFPYVDQSNPDELDENAHAWNLTKITVPSGGTIEVKYESDDYAYVQDKRAMEMFKVEGVGYSSNFDPGAPGNFLFKDKTTPALYIYFKRRLTEELYPGDIAKSYLEGISSVQYNFEIKINSSGETTPSCGIPLVDNIKGYADIESSGITSNLDYAYIKILPKYAEKTGQLISSISSTSNFLILNPIAVSAIHYAQYYNNKALNPSSEIVNPNVGQILGALGTAFTEYSNYVRNPMISHINKSIAKEFNLGRSYIRLQSQGYKKGGGHRVKEVKSTDKWNQMGTGQDEAIYGTRYNYETTNENGKTVSSGVATYEPLVGGDENPLRNRVHTDKIGKKRVFPMTEPIELIVEEPLGESLFPSPTVGYSKITVSSIHKDIAQSAQVVQQNEYYTAKDFPVNVINSELETWVDEYPKKVSFRPIKKDELRVAQSYVITLNDMHGKQKASRTLVDKGNGKMQEVSYTYYNYFTSYNNNTKTNTLDNSKIPCAIWNSINSKFEKSEKELGVEVDFTFDTREKMEKSRTWGLNVNTNTILLGIVPLPIPMPIPQIPKGQDRIFSSVVATKIVQQYGILKSVETFDKGATLIVENELFDAITGQALITKVNTEHKDNEYNIKRPAYWAYNSLGPSYENIHYEQNIGGRASIVNDKCYIYLNQDEMSRFNLGDELEITLGSTCENATPRQDKFKLWVVDKSSGGVNLPQAIKDKCSSQQPPCTVPNYWYDLNYKIIAPQAYSGKEDCFTPTMVKNYLQILARDPLLAGMNIEKAEFIHNPSVLKSGQAILLPSLSPADQANLTNSVNPLFPYSTNNGVNFSPSGLLGTPLSPSIPISNSIALKPYAWGQGIPGVSPPNYNHAFNMPKYDFSVKVSAGYQNAEKFQTSTKLIKYTYSVKYSPEYYLHGIINNTNANLYKNTTYSYLGAIGTVANLKSALEGSNSGSTFSANGNSYSINYYSNDVVPDMYKDANSFLTLFQSDYVGYSGFVINALPTKAVHYPNPNDPIFKDINFTLDVYVPWADGTPMPNAFSNYQTPWTNPSNFTFKNVCELGSPGYFMPAYHNLANGIYGNSIPTFNNFTSTQGTAYMTRINVNEITRESVTVVDRDVISDKNNTPALVCLPLKRMAKASNDPTHVWPSNDSIFSATVKVIRSGKKNRMMENAETATTLSSPYGGNNTLNDVYHRVLNIEATEYTDDFHLPDELNDPSSVYFNPYAVGGKGYYLPYKGYQYHANREYASGGIDKDKGVIANVTSFWMQSSAINNTKKFRNMQPAFSDPLWQPKYTVLKYDPWGRDLEVRDASGNINCNLFGYNNRLPIAVVSNSKSDNALFENFEDYDPLFFNHKFINYVSGLPGQEFVLTLLQSPLKKIITDNLIAGPSQYQLGSSSHSGIKSLVITNAPVSLPIQFTSGSLVSIFNKPTLYPFSFKPEKYLINYWQKVNNNSNIPSNGAMKLNINGNNFFAKPKSPIIDGWVLYEAIVDASVYANQTITNCDLSIWTSATLDDLRILPYQANMKAYVYHPENKRLLAVMDENHMSTRFDYSAEGKLLRIKKETEKGILTLKESRESLNNIVAPLQINSTYDLSDPNSIFQPVLPAAGIGTVVGDYPFNPLMQ